MTPTLFQMLNSVISGEEALRLCEEHEMNQSHAAGLQGYKRFHRYRAHDRGKHSIMLQNFMVEYLHVEPQVTVNYMTPTTGMSFIEGIRAMHDKGLLQLEMLESTANKAFEEGEHHLAGYLEDLIKDESMEVSRYYRLLLDASRENADLNFLSYKLHKKMKAREGGLYEGYAR